MREYALVHRKQGRRHEAQASVPQTEDWSFWSLRLPLARAAKAAGYEVVVALNVDAHGDAFARKDFASSPSTGDGAASIFFKELFTLLAIVRLYAREKPDIVHRSRPSPSCTDRLPPACAVYPIANT